MKHPILGGVGSVYYGLIWLIVALAHTAVLYFYFELPLAASLEDSLVFNILFAGLGLGFWYIVKYSSPESKDNFRPMVTLIITGLFAVGLWIWVGTSILELLQVDPTYRTFLQDSRIWRLVSGSLYYAVIILIYYLISYNQNLQEQKSRQLQLATAAKEAELKMLKFQINPHFIFNSLNSISSLTLSNPQKAQQMIVKLSNFLRYSLGKDNRDTNLLQDEIENIKLYLDIEKVRFGDRLVFETNIHQGCNDCRIPNLILQPLFENAVKHGVQESIETIQVTLSAERLHSALFIEVTNNFDEEAVSQKGAGIGLKNIKQRLALLYGSEDLLQFEKNGSLFKVTVEIPQ